MKQEQGEEEDEQRKGTEKSRVKVYGGGIRIIMSADTEAIDNLKQQHMTTHTSDSGTYSLIFS